MAKAKDIVVILLPVDGDPVEATIPNTMEGMQQAIGGRSEDVIVRRRGYFRPIRLRSIRGICNLYVDEEGYLKKLPVNEVASKLAGTVLVGPCFLGMQRGSGNASMTPEESAAIMAIVKRAGQRTNIMVAPEESRDG